MMPVQSSWILVSHRVDTGEIKTTFHESKEAAEIAMDSPYRRYGGAVDLYLAPIEVVRYGVRY